MRGVGGIRDKGGQCYCRVSICSPWRRRLINSAAKDQVSMQASSHPSRELGEGKSLNDTGHGRLMFNLGVSLEYPHTPLLSSCSASSRRESPATHKLPCQTQRKISM